MGIRRREVWRVADPPRACFPPVVGSEAAHDRRKSVFVEEVQASLHAFTQVEEVQASLHAFTQVVYVKEAGSSLSHPFGETRSYPKQNL